MMVMVDRAIWKFPLALDPGPQPVELPVGTTVLHLGPQNSRLYMWAAVCPDPGVPKEIRTFQVFATGETIPKGYRVLKSYIGTYVGPTYVWHVYEVR